MNDNTGEHSFEDFIKNQNGPAKVFFQFFAHPVDLKHLRLVSKACKDAVESYMKTQSFEDKLTSYLGLLENVSSDDIVNDPTGTIQLVIENGAGYFVSKLLPPNPGVISGVISPKEHQFNKAHSGKLNSIWRAVEKLNAGLNENHKIRPLVVDCIIDFKEGDLHYTQTEINNNQEGVGIPDHRFHNKKYWRFCGDYWRFNNVYFDFGISHYEEFPYGVTFQHAEFTKCAFRDDTLYDSQFFSMFTGSKIRELAIVMLNNYFDDPYHLTAAEVREFFLSNARDMVKADQDITFDEYKTHDNCAVIIWMVHIFKKLNMKDERIKELETELETLRAERDNNNNRREKRPRSDEDVGLGDNPIRYKSPAFELEELEAFEVEEDNPNDKNAPITQGQKRPREEDDIGLGDHPIRHRLPASP